jgi:hypothetical protein
MTYPTTSGVRLLDMSKLGRKLMASYHGEVQNRLVPPRTLNIEKRARRRVLTFLKLETANTSHREISYGLIKRYLTIRVIFYLLRQTERKLSTPHMSG